MLTILVPREIWRNARECARLAAVFGLVGALAAQAGDPGAGAGAGAGDALRIDMVTIRGGEFGMGCDDPYGECEHAHSAARTEMVSSYQMARHEVTVGQFRAFVEATHYLTDAERDVEVDGSNTPGCMSQRGSGIGWVAGRSWRDPGFAQAAEHPVVCVSWHDAKAYAQWMSQVTGEPYRLPSEVEWEYAASAVSQNAYSQWASRTKACRYGNGADQTPGPDGNLIEDGAPCQDGYFYTAPVGQFQANAFGLHDMVGNVWEWVQEIDQERWVGASKYQTGSLTDLQYHARRGGSWYNKPALVRPTARRVDPLHYRNALIGFRLAMDQ
ncbi:MAG: formylglycine-generating enzyme family protein [Gammaproteobacteria bacterium]